MSYSEEHLRPKKSKLRITSTCTFHFFPNEEQKKQMKKFFFSKHIDVKSETLLL